VSNRGRSPEGDSGPVDPNLPLQVQLEPYKQGEAYVVATLDDDRIVLRIVDHEQKRSLVRSMKLVDSVSQAAWLVAMAEAGGLEGVEKKFAAELSEARAHVQKRLRARFPETTTHHRTTTAPGGEDERK
jgi:hypothetical protein